MSNRSAAVISLLLVALSLVVGVLLHPELPDPMPSHWNAAGEVDGFMPKPWGVFLLPLVTAGLTLMLLAIPAIDPLKANATTSGAGQRLRGVDPGSPRRGEEPGQRADDDRRGQASSQGPRGDGHRPVA